MFHILFNGQKTFKERVYSCFFCYSLASLFINGRQTHMYTAKFFSAFSVWAVYKNRCDNSLFGRSPFFWFLHRLLCFALPSLVCYVYGFFFHSLKFLFLNVICLLPISVWTDINRQHAYIHRHTHIECGTKSKIFSTTLHSMCINCRTIWPRCSTHKIKHILFFSVRVVYVCL